MKTTAIIMMMMAVCITGCNAQEDKGGSSIDKKAEETNSMGNQPRISWEVKKEVDEDNNIIRYDSTYTWSYTNMEGDSVTVNIDSVMQSFNRYFYDQFPSIWDKNFIYPYRNDSLLQQDFFKDDYFQNQWRQNYFQMEEMFMGMDSLRSQFLLRSYPGLIEPQKNKND